MSYPHQKALLLRYESISKPIESKKLLSKFSQILELLEHKAIFTAGYKCILHVHSVVEECECVKLIAVMDPKTKEKKKVCQAAGCLHFCVSGRCSLPRDARASRCSKYGQGFGAAWCDNAVVGHEKAALNI